MGYLARYLLKKTDRYSFINFYDSSTSPVYFNFTTLLSVAIIINTLYPLRLEKLNREKKKKSLNLSAIGTLVLTRLPLFF